MRRRSASLLPAGALAAVKAGLGITGLPKEIALGGLAIPDGAPLASGDAAPINLRDMSDTEIALLAAPTLRAPVRRLE